MYHSMLVNLLVVELLVVGLRPFEAFEICIVFVCDDQNPSTLQVKVATDRRLASGTSAGSSDLTTSIF